MTDFAFPDSPAPGTNRTAKPSRCELCGGDRFVTVRLRSPEQTAWMQEKGLKPSTVSFHEETAPCPDCNPQEVSYHRHDGSLFRTLDPAAVRQMLAQ